MVRLHAAGEYEKRKLWKLLQAYLHELAPYYAETPNACGIYEYPRFASYFDGSDPARLAIFIHDDTDSPAGFALVNAHSATGEPVDHAIAEFYIRPELRRRGYGGDALAQILDGLPGRWHIRYARANTAAARFWEAQTQRFSPTVVPLDNGREQVLAFTT